MKQFEKWEKKFYTKHRGVYHFDPTCKMGWKGALEEVLEWLDHSSEHKEIADRIHNELES